MRNVLFFLFIPLLVFGSADRNTSDANTTKSKKEKFSGSSIKEGKTDTIVVKGAVLQGQVTGLTSQGLSFSLIYGRGSILISYADIDTLTTEHSYHIFYNGKETVGKISGLYEHRWLVIDQNGSKEMISVTDVDRFILSIQDDNSFTNKLHNLIPFWSGNVDLGIEIDQGGVNKRKLDISGRFEYHRQRDRIVVFGSRENDTQEVNSSEGWTVTKDEYLVNVEGNRFLSKERREHLFLIAGFERDAIREIASRAYPAGGAGYKWMPTDNFWLMMQLGVGGVFNNYMTYGRNYYWAAYGGGEYYYTFFQGVVLRGKIFFMPSIVDSYSSWLFRFNSSLAFPLSNLFALKLTLEDVDDNNPAPDIGNNKITTTFSLSFTF